MDLHYAPFVAGVLAGANGTLVGHLFDTLKTRFQVGRALNNKVDFFFIRQLYRGILPPLLTSGAIQSTSFFLFENFRSRLQQIGNHSDLGAIFIAGSLSGSLVSLVSNPISIVKIRQQVESSGTVVQCVNEIYAASGLRAFYRGFGAMLALDASRGLYLTIYEIMKRSIVSTEKIFRAAVTDGMGDATQTSSYPPDVLNSGGTSAKSTNSGEVGQSEPSTAYFTEKALPTRMLAAALTGMVSWCIIFPIDVIRVRMHLDFASLKYISWRDCCAQTWAEGGIRMFYRGLGYTLVRAGPVSAASLTTYEFAKELLEEDRQ